MSMYASSAAQPALPPPLSRFPTRNPASRAAYAQVKTALAKYHAEDVDAYYDVKDPVCDIIIAGAELWAEKTGWKMGPSDC